MLDFLRLLIHALAAPLRTQAQLEAEIAMLRHQLNVLRRQTPRPRLTAVDRLLFVWLCRLFPSLRSAITIVQPDTVLRWHRMGFRLYWRWKSRPHGGRPKIPIEVRSLIRRMSTENPLWGALRIHGELLKLGIEVAQSTVARYMAKRRPGSSGQKWKSFLRNHGAGIAAMDFLVVPTINFRLLSVLVVLRHERRRLICLSVTDHSIADWIAQQITEAFPWEEAPSHLIRDRDARYGHAVRRRLAAMGVRDHPTAPRSPWQNGHAERLIGSIRRDLSTGLGDGRVATQA
jgi:transposase InsO family protein